MNSVRWMLHQLYLKPRVLLVLSFSRTKVDFSCLVTCVDYCTAKSYVAKMKLKRRSFFSGANLLVRLVETNFKNHHFLSDSCSRSIFCVLGALQREHLLIGALRSSSCKIYSVNTCTTNTWDWIVCLCSILETASLCSVFFVSYRMHRDWSFNLECRMTGAKNIHNHSIANRSWRLFENLCHCKDLSSIRCCISITLWNGTSFVAKKDLWVLLKEPFAI